MEFALQENAASAARACEDRTPRKKNSDIK
jgi:hypothetical protein